MNKLIPFKSMTSKDISKLTGKKHFHIIRDINDEIKQLGEEIARTIFGLGYYLDSNNQKRKMYILTKEGVLQLAARYDAVVRYKLIQKALNPPTKEESLYEDCRNGILTQEDFNLRLSEFEEVKVVEVEKRIPWNKGLKMSKDFKEKCINKKFLKGGDSNEYNSKFNS